MPPGISVPGLPRPLAISCCQVSAAQAEEPKARLRTASVVQILMLLSSCRPTFPVLLSTAYRTPPAVSECSLAFLRFLQDPFIGKVRLTSKLNVLAGDPHLIAVRLIRWSIKAQFVSIDLPRSRARLAHGEGVQAATLVEDVGPMNLIGQLHSCEAGSNLPALELPERIGSSVISSNSA